MSFLSNLLPLVCDLSPLQAPHDLFFACTALLLRDANAGAYAGRTMELSMELPYVIAAIPKGHSFASSADGHQPLRFVSDYAIFAIAVPNGSVDDLKIVEGVNEQGLSFSVLAYAGASGPADNAEKTKAMLAAIDLGAFVLGQCATTGAQGETRREPGPFDRTGAAAWGDNAVSFCRA